MMYDLGKQTNKQTNKQSNKQTNNKTNTKDGGIRMSLGGRQEQAAREAKNDRQFILTMELREVDDCLI